MDERREHFLAMLGASWDAARMAGLSVRLDFADGSRREGSPTAGAQGSGREELDDTGTRSELEIDGLPVDVAGVVAYGVRWSERPPAHELGGSGPTVLPDADA